MNGASVRGQVPEAGQKLDPRNFLLQESKALLRAHEQMEYYEYDDGGGKYQQRETAGVRGGVCAMRGCRLNEQARCRGNDETQYETFVFVFHCGPTS